MKKTIVITFALLVAAFTTQTFAQDAMKKDMMDKGHKTEAPMKKGMAEKGVMKKDMMKKDVMKKDMMKKDVMKKDMMKKAPKTIKLSQTPGEFNIEGLILSEGSYVFEISNETVDHAVGFVLAPKGKTGQANHIKEAYVQKTPVRGETSTSKVVNLTPGEYVYFCPLNKTPQYSITVK